jgi:hypothetical protein
MIKVSECGATLKSSLMSIKSSVIFTAVLLCKLSLSIGTALADDFVDSKQFLINGETIDAIIKRSPREASSETILSYIKAAEIFPTSASCLKGESESTEIDWPKINNVTEATVCIFRIVAKFEDSNLLSNIFMRSGIVERGFYKNDSGHIRTTYVYENNENNAKSFRRMIGIIKYNLVNALEFTVSTDRDLGIQGVTAYLATIWEE